MIIIGFVCIYLGIAEGVKHLRESSQITVERVVPITAKDPI